MQHGHGPPAPDSVGLLLDNYLRALHAVKASQARVRGLIQSFDGYVRRALSKDMAEKIGPGSEATDLDMAAMKERPEAVAALCDRIKGKDGGALERHRTFVEAIKRRYSAEVAQLQRLGLEVARIAEAVGLDSSPIHHAAAAAGPEADIAPYLPGPVGLCGRVRARISTGRQPAGSTPANRLTLAWQSFERAVNHPDGPPPRPLAGVYKWLEHHDPDRKYDLPDFPSWSKYLRDYKRLQRGGQPRNAPRRGREGRSVAKPDQL